MSSIFRMIQPPFLIRDPTTCEQVTVLALKLSMTAALESATSFEGKPSAGASGRGGSSLLGDIFRGDQEKDET